MKIAFISNKLHPLHENCAYVIRYMSRWKHVLEERGHTVEQAERIGQLPEPLSASDIAIAHPYLEEYPLLISTVHNNPHFRWILLSVGSHTMSESNQFRVYPDILDSQTLVELIEDEWESPMQKHKQR